MLDEIQPTKRVRTPFLDNWLFKRGDVLSETATVSYDSLHLASVTTADYLRSSKRFQRQSAGCPESEAPHYAETSADESEFRPVRIPHDFGIEGPFSQDLPGETGKLPWSGVGWYRTHFFARVGEQERLILEVDGAMSYSLFWLNGKFLGGWAYGYTAFQLDLTEHLDPSGNNVLAVRLDNPENSSRFYPGAGLYRHLWLTQLHAVHIAPQGLFVHCPWVERDHAIVNIDLFLENDLALDVEVTIHTEIAERSACGTTAAAPRLLLEQAGAFVASNGTAKRTVCATIQNPKLWSLDHCHQYQVSVSIRIDGVEVDSVTEAFGIRSIAFDADRGFLLNHQHVPIRGVCMHHDLGALGAAVSRRAIQRQIEILKDMGVNSIRTSHNPPAPELLELCDEMGILLLVEAFDCWRAGKKLAQNTSEAGDGRRFQDYARAFEMWHEPDLRAMVRHSRNHPSVILYSIGNEILEQWEQDGWMLACELYAIAKQEDRTRLITAGCNFEQAAYNGFQTALDVLGFNYKPFDYERLHRQNPTLPILATETASTVSTRGEYFFPVSDDKSLGQANFHVSSYDLYAPPWAYPPDIEFRGLDEAPYVAGEYVWTGFDYLGEPTPYNCDSSIALNFTHPEERARHERELIERGTVIVPSRSSYFGIVDLAGFPKDRFFLYQARFRPDLRMAHILPHWNWPERMGLVTPVHVYTSADEAELFLNNVSQGRHTRNRLEYRFRWNDVKYTPGVLRVVTYKNGVFWAESTRETTGTASTLSLRADRLKLDADGHDLAFITVSVVDEVGRVVPRCDTEIECEVSGAACFVATDNGDPTSLVPFSSRRRAAHQGLLLIIVRSRKDERGTATISVRASGLKSGALHLECE